AADRVVASVGHDDDGLDGLAVAIRRGLGSGGPHARPLGRYEIPAPGSPEMARRRAAVAIAFDSIAEDLLVIAQRHDRRIARARLDAAAGKILAHLERPRTGGGRLAVLILQMQALINAAVTRTAFAHGSSVGAGV